MEPYHLPPHTQLSTLDVVELIAYSAGILEGSQSPSISAFLRNKPDKMGVLRLAIETWITTKLPELKADPIFALMGSMYSKEIVDLSIETFPAAVEPGSIGVRTHIPLVIFSELAWNPHMHQYINSTHSPHSWCKQLAIKLAKNMIAALQYWMMYDQFTSRSPPAYIHFISDLQVSTKLLIALLIFVAKKKSDEPLLPSELQSQLLGAAGIWIDTYDRAVGEGVRHVKSLLVDRAKEHGGPSALARKLSKIDTCALPGCSLTAGLKACGRCKSVRYCSSEHQRMHWADSSASHKFCCYRSDSGLE